MKSLYLIRHAHAVGRMKGLKDFDRPLRKKGIERAVGMARQFKKRSRKPDYIISSPAERATATATIFAKELGYPVEEIQQKDLLYSATTANGFLNIVRSIDDDHSTVLLFGHNPTLNLFASKLMKHFKYKIPKAGIVGIRFKNPKWNDIAIGSGSEILFDYPTFRASHSEKIPKELESKIARLIFPVLEEIDQSAAEKCKPKVRAYSKKLANKFIKASKR